VSDLRERFRVLDRLEPPDVWPEAERRRPGTARLPEHRGRVLASAVAVAVAVAGFAVAVRAFSDTTPPRPAQQPIVQPKANGAIHFRVGGGDGPSWISSVLPDGTGERTVFPADSPVHYDRIAFSPDGSRIAFNDYLVHEFGIETANPDGTNLVRLTVGVNDSWASWSPDGTRISFSSTRYDPSIDQCTPGADVICPTDIYVMDADGSNVQRLTTDPAPEYAPSWSPDGTRIAIVKTLNGTYTAIFTMNPDGSDIRQLSSANGGTDFAPSWSPDGSQLAFAAIRHEETGIWIVNSDGTDEHPMPGEVGHWYANDPVWSPDGTLIAFVGNPGGSEDALYVMNQDGSGVIKLADAPRYGVAGDIAWQPLPAAAPTPSPIEAKGRVTATIPISAFPNSVLVSEGSIWVSGGLETAGQGDLVRLDPITGEVLARIPMQGLPSWEVGGGGMTAGLGSIWVLGNDQHGTILQRVDPASNHLVAVIPILPDTNDADVWVDETGIWVLMFSRHDPGLQVVVVDPSSYEIGKTIPIAATWAHWIFGAGGSIWVLGNAPNSKGPIEIDTLYRIDPSTGTVTTVTLPGYAWKPVVAGDTVWLEAGDDHVVELDATSGTLGQPIQVRLVCCSGPFVGDGAGGIWVASVYDGHDATFSHVSAVGTGDAEGAIPPDQLQDWSGVDSAFDPVTGSLWVVHYRDSMSRIEISDFSDGLPSPSDARH
jgi:hypothetical protein